MKILLYIMLALAALRSSADETIEGVWITQRGDSKIEIIYDAETATYSGKIIWVEDSYKDFTGQQILKGVIYKKDSDTFVCPWIYDPKLGITASGVAKVSGNTLYLKARKGVLTKKGVLTRVSK